MNLLQSEWASTGNYDVILWCLYAVLILHEYSKKRGAHEHQVNDALNVVMFSNILYFFINFIKNLMISLVEFSDINNTKGSFSIQNNYFNNSF